MSKRFIFTYCLVFFISSICAQNKAEVNPCLTLEQSLYLNDALSNIRDANAYMDSLKACSNDDDINRFAQAKYLYKNDRYEDAYRILKEVDFADKINREISDEVNFYLALSASALYKYQEAFNYYSESIKNGYKTAWCYNNLGMLCKKFNELANAIKFLEKATETDPGYALAYFNLGEIYYDQVNFHRAQEYYILADSAAHHLNVYYRLAITITYDDMDMGEEAYESAKIGYESFPKSREAIRGMGTGLAAVERFDEARHYARLLKKEGIRSADDLFGIGILYGLSGSTDTAAYYYTACLKLDSNYTAALTNLAIFYKRIGNFELAHEYLNRSLRIDSTDQWAINMKIQTYMWQHEYEKSLEWCRRYNELYMGGPNSYLNTGYLLLLLERYTEAIPWLYKKLGQFPEDDRAWNNLGACYTALNRKDSARYCFDKALEYEPDNSYVYHNRALLNLDLDKEDAACRDLETALEKQYNWVIDERLLKLQKRHCPEVRVDRKVLIFSYTGNARELLNKPFITRFDSLAETAASDIVISADELTSLRHFENETNNQNAFQVYPNPTSGAITILYSGGAHRDQNTKLRVYNLQGKLLQSVELSNAMNRLNLENYTPGLYILMFYDQENVLSTRKLIIER